MKGIGLIVLSGNVTIGSKITINGDIGFIANHISKAIVQPKNGYTGTLFEAQGQYRSEGTGVVSNISFENITFTGLKFADKALYIKGGYKILLSKCRFLNFTGEFVYFDQVYDSWVDKCVFDYSAGTDLTKPLFMLNYGSGDNTNQIHFNGCRWENFNRPAIKLNSGPNSYETVNEIKFISCKWESIYKTDFIVLNRCANINFALCNFAMPIGLSSDTPFMESALITQTPYTLWLQKQNGLYQEIPLSRSYMLIASHLIFPSKVIWVPLFIILAYLLK